MIMAGGEGTRLRPLTASLPKPMLPLVGRPMMEHVVNLLKSHGFEDLVVTVAFMAGAITEYFGDGSEFGVRITYSTEERPLGTAGSVRNAADRLDETFLVISGDVLTDVDLSAIVQFHRRADALATIGLVRVDNPREFGIVICGQDGTIERFLEKPTWGQVFSDTVNSGIFVLEPEIFRFIPPDRPVDFSGEVFPRLLEEGERVYGSVVEGYWEDVGTLEAYLRAHVDILDRRVQVEVPGFEVEPGVWLAEKATVNPRAEIRGPAVVGDHCRVEAGAEVGPYAVLGANVRVRGGACVERSVVGEGTYLAEHSRLVGAVVGRRCDVRRGARIEDGAVLGDHCFIGADASVAPGVKIFPHKTVEAGAVVNTSIVTESRAARSLFGRHGVQGLANVDVTPEMAAKLAMAYASTLSSGDTVVTSRDSSRSARMLKRAMMAGLNAAGVNVLDLEVATVPVTRFATRWPYVTGGVTVRLLPGDPQSVTIRFFDTEGLDVDEAAQRRIERVFDREEFRRVFASEIGDIGFPPRALEHYADALHNCVDLAAIRARRFKLVVDYSYGASAFAMPDLLAKLGAQTLAVNPFVSTPGLLSFDAGNHADEVGRIVKTSGADVGAVVTPDGEQLLLVDDRGRPLSGTQTLLVLASLVGRTGHRGSIVVPVDTTEAVEEVVDGMLELRWAKTSFSALMEMSTSDDVVLAGNSDGRLIVPRFMPAFDAAAALLLTLDLLARSGEKLSAVVDSLPEVHMADEAVVTPWEHKGAVMRALVEQAEGREAMFVDGVRIRLGHRRWVLVLPDPETPVVHVRAEGRDGQDARGIAAEYARRVEELARAEGSAGR